MTILYSGTTYTWYSKSKKGSIGASPNPKLNLQAKLESAAGPSVAASDLKLRNLFFKASSASDMRHQMKRN